jgi:hypothetical protein
MKRFLLLRSAALAALALTTTAAQASLFDLNYAGSFDSLTTLGGTALGADTPFSITATFDSSVKDLQRAGHSALYPITALTLSLNGTTYTSSDNSSLTVFLSDARYFANWAGLYGASGYDYKSFVSSFDNISNINFDVTASTLSATTFSSSNFNLSYGYSFGLAGVPGGLVISNFGASTVTASVAPTPVPEPSEYAAVVGLALGVFALVHHRRQAAAR